MGVNRVQKAEALGTTDAADDAIGDLLFLAEIRICLFGEPLGRDVAIAFLVEADGPIKRILAGGSALLIAGHRQAVEIPRKRRNILLELLVVLREVPHEEANLRRIAFLIEA